MKRLFFISIFLSLLINPPPIHAASNWGTCLVGDVPTISCIEPLFENILVIALRLITLAVFGMFFVGGLRLLFSGGDPKQTEMAYKTFTYAGGGLVGLFIIWFIFLFIEKFTGVTGILEFNPSFGP